MNHTVPSRSANLFCAIIVSFPRSGTHFTIDFIRRNFVEFAFLPRPWVSSETLYVNLDVRTIEADTLSGLHHSLSARPKANRDHFAAAQRPSFLVKTHDLPFSSHALLPRLREFTKDRQATKLYPFRKMSSTLVSYHAHQNGDGTVREFINRRDPFLGTSRSVMETMLDHGEWGLQNAIPIDIEDMQRRPDAYCYALAERFGWTLKPQTNPLPPKRVAAGSIGEIFERLRGRQSSEIVVRARNTPLDDTAFVDNIGPLADLYCKLKAVAFTPD